VVPAWRGGYFGSSAAYIFRARSGVTLFILRFFTSYFFSARRIEMSLILSRYTYDTKWLN
jgi:hypothetical protein